MILIATLVSIVGAILVSRGNAIAANSIWAVSNVFIIWHNYIIGEYEMAMLFVVYECVALYGVYYLWARKYIIEYLLKEMY